MTSVVVTDTTQTVVVTEGDGITVVTAPSAAVVVELGNAGPQGATGPGVTVGGATGDLLVKASAADYATAWTDAPTVDLLGFDLAAAEAAATGQLAWNADEGTLELGKLGGVSNYLGAETMALCRNNSNTVAIPKGTAVMFVGTVGNSGRLKVAPMVSNGSLPGYVFLGVTDQSIAGASDGYVSVFGKIRGIDTSTYADGDILWCNPAVAGGFTTIEPAAPNLKLAVAAVINAANNGSIFVRATTGNRLKDLHDVEAAAPTDNQVLAWSTAANRWQPAAPSSGLAVSDTAKVDKSVVYYDASTSSYKADADWTLSTIVDGANF